jgi:hypothetical protein
VVAQYPSDRVRQFSTQVYRFLDGSEQRFPLYAAALKRWVIRLDLLDEAELIRMEEFFRSEMGRAGTFSFEDPWDGTVYPDCSFDNDVFVFGLNGPGDAMTSVMVRENR